MTDDSKSFEKKIDSDFLDYLNLAKGLFENVKEESEQQLCEVWLSHLLGKTPTSLAEKCDRNIYLSRLLLQMQNGKLTGVFLDSPPSGGLACAFTTFGLPTEVDGLKGFQEMGFQVEASAGGDFSESSRDGRTYLATRRLPQGLMAFVAMTNNEGQPAWMPQTRPKSGTPGPAGAKSTKDRKLEGYSNKLLDYMQGKGQTVDWRKSEEERERVMEWLDKMISDCSKWIRGEDPHNRELEHLFEQLYQDYKDHPENSELLKHPRTVRTVLFKDIRDKLTERRAQVSKREMILDRYEAELYPEAKDGEECIDQVWLDCARKPISDSVKASLETRYPAQVIQRFQELLYQERLAIIKKGEKQAKRKIGELRRASIEDTKRELHRLKKAQDDYKELYEIYMEIEEKVKEIEKEWEHKCSKNEKAEEENMDKLKQQMEAEIQDAKRNLDKKVKAQHELMEKLEEAREAYRQLKERLEAEASKMKCEMEQVRGQKETLERQICGLKKRREEMKWKASAKKNTCRK